ncbi:MAG: tRNA (5-methylaminomethyl-2-thiouridine)(34)-methyltransferase MnmD, partial [Caulobacteraceae bacterium]
MGRPFFVVTMAPRTPTPDFDPRLSPAVWGEDGSPRSRAYNDVYFSADGGLAEARAVFLAGCGLPAAWAGRGRFVVAELGFGTGLNIAALLDLWRAAGPPGGRLSIFSVEANPLAADEAARALAPWPELAPIAERLIARWPGRARGFHRVDFPEFAATLDVAVMEAAAALAAWSGAADAWFLDGFAPARNPMMWRKEVLGLVARRSAPGARLATYSVAGHVRRDLAIAGFAVERRPGFGAKRQRLEGRLAAAASPVATFPPAQGPRVAIVGAGIAGAALARAFRALGVTAAVFDAAGPGAGASGGPAALVTPRLDAGLALPAALFAQAFRRAVALYGGLPDIILARGALQLPAGPKDTARFATLAGSDLFEPGRLRLADAAETSRRLGESVPAALAIEDALTVEPEPLLAAWLGETRRARVKAIDWAGGRWRLLGESGDLIAESELFFLAAGMECARLAPGLPLTPVRGQASVAAGVAAPTAAAFGAYAVATRDGMLFGATHDRGEESVEARPLDHARNLEALAQGLPALAARLAGAPLAARTGVRAATGDYLPLAGPVPDAPPGLFVLGGLGSRGFTLAPLLAAHLAVLALGAPPPLPADLAALVNPAR